MLSVHCLRFVLWPSYDLSWFYRCQSSHVGNSSSHPCSLWFYLIITVINKEEEKFPAIIVDFSGFFFMVYQVCVMHFEALCIQKFMMCRLWIKQVILLKCLSLSLVIFFFSEVNFVWNYYSHSNLFMINVYIEFLLLLTYIFIKYVGDVYT